MWTELKNESELFDFCTLHMELAANITTVITNVIDAENTSNEIVKSALYGLHQYINLAREKACSAYDELNERKQSLRVAA